MGRNGIDRGRLRFCGAVLAFLLWACAGHVLALGQQGRTCHLPGHDEPLRCLRVAVPLDYRQPERAKLELHVAVAAAYREAARADPLFILAGGPGQAGSDLLPLLDTTFRRVRATRDIVFIDQRGTGLSGKLDCPGLQTVDDLPEPEQGAAIDACMRSLNKPFAFYNTENAARDLERIRQALGYRQVNLWGASYGTRLAQTYARLHPASVRAMILDGVAPPDQIIFAWGSDVQAALDALFAQCAADEGCRVAFPDLPARFKALLQRVRAGEVTLEFSHPRTAQHTRMQLLPGRFIETVRVALYSNVTASRLPFIIDSAYKGNWDPFLAQMIGSSDLSGAATAIGLALSVTCAEDIPRLTPAIVAEEQSNSFLAGSHVRLLPGWCRSVDVPAVQVRAPDPIDAPALLLSGALDPVTPPRRARSAAAFIANAQNLVVPNAGHVVSPLGCAPRLLREFLDRPQQPLAADCLREIPPASFQLGPAGPRP